MQTPTSVSLNALRVFLVAARHMSIKMAANELLVTPGAVSHQIKSLERSLGKQLLIRSNNAIELTDAGTRLAQQAAPGLHLLHASLGDVMGDTNALRVRASMSFAVRWLIPKLHLFKARHPNVNVEVETFFDDERQVSSEADVTIGYYRVNERPKEARPLFDDLCRPYLTPGLLATRANLDDLTSIPAIQCTKGNWDWHLWLAETGNQSVPLSFAERFDMDDAALRAACAGMGMILSSRFMIETELSDGRLVPLPNSREASLGCYIVQVGPHDTSLTRKFVRWLREVAETSN